MTLQKDNSADKVNDETPGEWDWADNHRENDIGNVVVNDEKAKNSNNDHHHDDDEGDSDKVYIV